MNQEFDFDISTQQCRQRERIDRRLCCQHILLGEAGYHRRTDGDGRHVML